MSVSPPRSTTPARTKAGTGSTRRLRPASTMPDASRSQITCSTRHGDFMENNPCICTEPDLGYHKDLDAHALLDRRVDESRDGVRPEMHRTGRHTEVPEFGSPVHD